MEFWYLWLAVLGLSFVVIVLVVMIMDLRQELKAAKGEATEWYERARKHGWKPYWEEVQESLDSMNQSLAKIAEVGRNMRDAGKRMRDNAGSLRGINEQLNEVNTLQRDNVAKLERAAGTMRDVRREAEAIAGRSAEEAAQMSVRRAPSSRGATGPEAGSGTSWSDKKVESMLAAGRIRPEDLN